MTAQTETMRPSYLDEFPEPSHLLRKVILLFLLVTALAFGLVILFRQMSGNPVWLNEIFTTLSMALTAGFGSRFVIRNRTGFVRFIAAMAAYVVGLYMIGFASVWKYGMGPIEFWPKETDWDGIVQLAIGAVLLTMVLRAWRRPPSVVSESTAGSRRSAGSLYVRRTHNSPRATAMSNPQTSVSPKITTPVFSWPRFNKSGKKIKTLRSSASSIARNSRAHNAPLVLNKPVRSRGRGVFRRKPQVKLALVEEHRCPYCLEIVNRTDQRGTVECEVCHTLHHKDCWEITGMCQVPHLNT
jgi:hypothetical protein